jgi:hypothetical protein
VPDPVAFRTSLKVTLEHKGNRAESEDGWYIERPDYWSSVAFWYQTGEPAPREPLPGWPERCVPWRQHHLVRAFRGAHAGSGRVEVRTEGFFGGRPALTWTGAEPESRITLPFTVTEAGRYAVRLLAFGQPGGGRFYVGLSGSEESVDVEFGTAGFCEQDLLLGTHHLAAGEHRLEVRAIRGGLFSGELLRLLPLPPEATRERSRPGYEDHFIRLGIGRATYAYRLAYDRLPVSLEELAGSGIMPERYLTDEDGNPLRSRLDRDALLVEAVAWTHRFYGLDARR